jgi:HTH-type transcriptional regulator / antitoxin HigA
MSGRRAATIGAVYGKTEDRYLELVRRFPLRPLRTGADLDAAVAVIDALVDRPRLSSPERDYLDVLSDLIERMRPMRSRCGRSATPTCSAS